MKRPVVAAAVAVTVLSGCGERRQPPVPRQHAYQRIELYDRDYKTVEAGGVDILVNRCARLLGDSTSSTGSRWLTWSYPRYRATVYLTVTPVNPVTLSDVIDNRLERISLNAYGTHPEVCEAGNGKFDGAVYVSMSGTATPVQFLSTDNLSTVVSGAVSLDDEAAVANNDSVAPVIRALKADMIEMLESL